jgi:hypothetical protein
VQSGAAARRFEAHALVLFVALDLCFRIVGTVAEFAGWGGE